MAFIFNWSKVLVVLLSLTLAHTHDAKDLDKAKDLDVSLKQVSNTCDIAELTSPENIIKCFPERDKDGRVVIQDGTRCLISQDVQIADAPNRNELAMRQCVHGHWTDISLGIAKSIHKRFLGAFLGGIIGCALFCGSGGSSGGGSQPVNKPPTFDDPCRPSNLNDVYYVEAGRTYIVVTWPLPQAHDSDGSEPRVQQLQGQTSGSQFEGAAGSGRQHYITYRATDDDGLIATCYFYFTVMILTCRTAIWPANGQRFCTQNSNLGSVCTYSCNSGYELSGSSQIRCEGGDTPSWTPTPTCEKITCPPPPTLANGNIVCSNPAYTFGTLCYTTCDAGYNLNGPAYILCHEDKMWSFAASMTCQDNRPPTLTCLTSQTFYADRGKQSTSPEWVLPEVYDDSDPSPTITQTEGPAYGSIVPVGSSFVKYKAKDSQGNESPECTIEIRVAETTCSHPTVTLQGNNMAYSCSPASYTYGTECTLSCFYNIPLAGTNRITCERSESSSDPAVGDWHWGDGAEPFCNQTDCPTPDPPINGALAVNYIGTSKVLTMLCNDQFDIPHVGTGFSGMFFCTNRGVYSPTFDIPDCIEPKNPRSVSLRSEIFYYSGDCTDPTTREQIKAQVRQILNTTANPINKNLCPAINNCIISEPQIICGPVQTRKKRNTRASSSHLERHKRETLPTMIVEFHIIADIHLNETVSFLTALDRVDELLNATVKPYIQSLVDNGTFDLDGFELRNDSFQTPDYGDIQCHNTSYSLVGIKCLPCPPTYYLNTTTEKCKPCPVGSYSDVAALTECKVCPAGYTTLETGSRNASQCLEQCPAGRYSSTGTVPCALCPVGYYQSGTGRTSCIKCTTGTTEFTGSVTSTACQAFQIFVRGTSGRITAGSVSSNMTDITLTFWTRLFGTTNTYVRLTSEGNERISIHLTDSVRVIVPGTSFDKTVGPIASTLWVHIAITWNSTDGALSMYINGQLRTSGSYMPLPSSPLVLLGALQFESIGSKGLSITGLHLVDAVLSTTEISSMVTSCWTERPNDVLNMTDVLDMTPSGIQIQTPLTCDATDECASNPCNNHTCVNGINTFTCYCSGGWSGTTCTTPPDYCINHACENGATCVNGNNGYTCTCVAGYSGELCDIPPVNGGFSEWEVWGSCSVTCGGGTRHRTRACDSPAPSEHGADCVGETIDIQPCSSETCPKCPDLERGFRAVVNCTEDAGTGDQACKIVCLENYILPEAFTDVVYRCGVGTDYTWSPLDNAPDCVDPKAPLRYEVDVAIAYNTSIDGSAIPDVQTAVTDNLNTIPCVTSGVCNSTVDITESDATVKLYTDISKYGELGGQTDNSTANTTIQELVDAINDLETSASYINLTSSQIFDVTVNEITYVSNQETLTFSGTVTCPSGETAINGVCAPCPAGTYHTSGHCTYCRKGTYSSSTGQTSCTPCPSGLSTTTIGSHAASQCTDIMTTTTTATNNAISTSSSAPTSTKATPSTANPFTETSLYTTTTPTVTSSSETAPSTSVPSTSVTTTSSYTASTSTAGSSTPPSTTIHSASSGPTDTTTRSHKYSTTSITAASKAVSSTTSTIVHVPSTSMSTVSSYRPVTESISSTTNSVTESTSGNKPTDENNTVHVPTTSPTTPTTERESNPDNTDKSSSDNTGLYIILSVTGVVLLFTMAGVCVFVMRIGKRQDSLRASEAANNYASVGSAAYNANEEHVYTTIYDRNLDNPGGGGAMPPPIHGTAIENPTSISVLHFSNDKKTINELDEQHEVKYTTIYDRNLDNPGGGGAMPPPIHGTAIENPTSISVLHFSNDKITINELDEQHEVEYYRRKIRATSDI